MFGAQVCGFAAGGLTATGVLDAIVGLGAATCGVGGLGATGGFGSTRIAWMLTGGFGATTWGVTWGLGS